jgi:hypothetical protein
MGVRVSASEWRYALASVVGASHLKSQTPCQDASRCEIVELTTGETILIAVASDGAGSARQAAAGSEFAVKYFLQTIATAACTGQLPAITRDLVAQWFDCFRVEVAATAQQAGFVARDYACTVVAAAVAESAALFFQIGDGSIVINTVEDQEYQWVFWPDRGEYENVTYFATDPGSLEHLQFELIATRIAELCVFTDGLQRMALHYASGMAHAPFFNALFPPLRAVPAGHSDNLSASLAGFLASKRVNERTDDDKTLILASRMSAVRQA